MIQERRIMMKKNVKWVGLVTLVLFVSVAFLTGCAKKPAVKSDTTVTSQQTAMSQQQAEKEAAEKAAREAAEKEAREKALREQSLRDKADKDAKDTKDAADRVKKEAAAKAAAILQELQIPDITFDYNKYNLMPEARATLKAGAPAYLKYKEYKLVVEGHCDERGTVEYNLALGEKRATEAAKYLIDLGIEKERIKTISYGKEMPLDQGHDEAAWAKNRRAHFVIFPPVK
jgi:peptidoglycan-associated lipoprotein